MTTPTPTAEIIRRYRRTITVRCPYCQQPHAHTILETGPQQFAPGCGMQRTITQRIQGYQFHIPNNQERETS